MTTSAPAQSAVPETISVVATTVEGTEAALVAAQRAAKANGARVDLLVPRAESKAPSGERFVDTTNWLVERYRKIARDVGQPVQVRVCACRNAVDAATLLCPVHGTVFVGGPERWWWPTAEERLAAQLRRAGRDVVFVGCNRG